MTHEASRDAAVDVRGYLAVFATLLVLTIVTVAVSYAAICRDAGDRARR